MLRTITLKNFVHFKDKTVIQLTTSNNSANSNRNRETEKSNHGIDYCSSLNIFVGANFCGKSTIIELIRRCMTPEINVSKTKAYDNKLVSYVFCKFKELDKNGEVFSGIIKEPQQTKDRVEKLYKIFIYTEENKAFLRSISTHTGKTYSGVLDNKYIKEIRSLEDEADKSDKGITQLLEMIKRLNYKTCSFKIRNKPSWKDIEDQYIATFPLRGIGIVQWTKSKNIRVKGNYKSACERAEVISTLLTQKHRGQINKQLEEEIFNFLTYPEVFIFKQKNDGHIFVQHNNSEDFHLLKTSEGILEAKMLSLLLAYKGVKTLCLEDAERGMHPQMIERLKTVLCREGRQKTIIVVTHSPYFIDTITVKNTHVFFRKTPEDCNNSYSCSVRNVANCSALSKVSSIELLRTLLFATKVLLVEGPTDKEVVQGIFTQWKRTMLDESKDKIGDLYTDITTYQVVSLNGCRNSKNVKFFCDEIELKCLCVLDLDAVGLRTDLNNTFVWRDGALEDMIRLSKSSEQLCKILGCTKNNTEIKNKLKNSRSETDQKSFNIELMKVDEVKRLVEFILQKESTRFDQNSLKSVELLSEQKCCNIFNVLIIAFTFVLLVSLLLVLFRVFLNKNSVWKVLFTM